jgi:predicted nucleic acid-binding protein
MMFDSDVLIWFLRGDVGAAKLIEAERTRVASIISMMELIQGSRSRTELAVIRRFFKEQQFDVLPIDEPASYLAASLIESHAQSHGLQIADALIAATALDHGEVLATANVRHFRVIEGLQVKEFRPQRPVG